MQHAFDATDPSKNPGGVFVDLLDKTSTPVSLGADKSGGIGTPDVNVAGLSRTFGAVSGVADQADEALNKFASGQFDPKKYFKDIGNPDDVVNNIGNSG